MIGAFRGSPTLPQSTDRLEHPAHTAIFVVVIVMGVVVCGSTSEGGGYVRFQLLGAVQLTDGDRSITVDGTKSRVLLAVLLINLNAVVSTSRLVEHLWGDEPPATAVGTLHAYISRLRRLVGPDVLLTRRPGYLLKVDPDHVDVRRFERLLAQGMAAVRDGEPHRAVSVLREALALWQGPCLAEFADQPMLADEIARMEGLRAAAAEQCMGAELAWGRHAEVVEEIRALVVEYPTREGLWCHLMLALYRCGRQAEALDAFRRARARLNDELGIEPGPALRTLQSGVLHHDPDLAWTVRPPYPRVPLRISGWSILAR
jgi:DNA-binding SARP family transcriptional activator